MSKPTRDLHDYTLQYRNLPFESIQASFRRRMVLQRIKLARPQRLLEIGCGENALFTDLPGQDVTVVEPSIEFADVARKSANRFTNVQVINGFLEDVNVDLGQFDGVVISCLLHEVTDPAALLQAAKHCCAQGAWLHVNVPNSQSLHRLLAVAMGLITESSALSDMQLKMQQQRTYDSTSLQAAINDAGFTCIDSGSLFIKPFTHQQMQSLVDLGFMTSAILEGLDRLSMQLPVIGSEIWCEARCDNA